jgi:hypothetical protein
VLVVKETGSNKRPKPLTYKHSRQSNKTKERRRGRRQVHQAKNNPDGKTSKKGEHHGTQRNELITHSGSLASDRPDVRPYMQSVRPPVRSTTVPHASKLGTPLSDCRAALSTTTNVGTLKGSRSSSKSPWFS